MLKIAEAAPNGLSATVDVNWYLPVDVTWFHPTPESRIFWRGGDGVDSILEVGINHDDGILYNVEVTLAKRCCLGIPANLRAETLPCIAGLPVIDTTAWPSELVEVMDAWVDEEVNGFIFYIDDDSVALQFIEICPIVKCFKAGHVSFFVDQTGYLQAVVITGFTTDEMTILREYAMRLDPSLGQST